MVENDIRDDAHVLVCIDRDDVGASLPQALLNELLFLKRNFCGVVITDQADLDGRARPPFSCVYLTGDAIRWNAVVRDKWQADRVYAIRELSTTRTDEVGAIDTVESVGLGQVPVSIHGLGVYFRGLYSDPQSYFSRICARHNFQTLTESNKSDAKALRTGVYISRAHYDAENEDEIRFHLLRCSSNLDGPTESFAEVDDEVVGAVKKNGQPLFRLPFDPNHVLAQIYHNRRGEDGKERKAAIKAHSDKTKDMPEEGVIAFVTFYDFDSNDRAIRKTCRSEDDAFDVLYRGNNGSSSSSKTPKASSSMLTSIVFRLKNKNVAHKEDPTLVEEFKVTLYPGSVFIVPLRTNRLYTHEIRPSGLPVEMTPTRMGYVVRCSAMDAVFRNGKTHIQGTDGNWTPLHSVTPQDATDLKGLYLCENATTDRVRYPSRRMAFSMNAGDYMKPCMVQYTDRTV